MTSSGSPITSEMIRDLSRPARQARASLPPLIWLSCLRTVFNSRMFAPAPLRCLVTACLSAKVMPGTGAGSSAEPPPESRQTHRSSASALATSSRICREPSTPAKVGSLTPAGRAPCNRIRRSSRTQSSGTFTTPASCLAAISDSPSTDSSPSAIPAPALPAPTTTMRRISDRRIRSCRFPGTTRPLARCPPSADGCPQPARRRAKSPGHRHATHPPFETSGIASGPLSFAALSSSVD